MSLHASHGVSSAVEIDQILRRMSEVVASQAGVLRDSREHARTYLVARMKRENEIRPSGAR